MQSQNESNYIRLLRQPIKSEKEVEEMMKFQQLFLRELKEETEVLIRDLSSVGINCESVWELVNTKMQYFEAIDVLIKHLQINYHDKNKEGIIRALTVKEAKGRATDFLIKEYEQTSKEKDNLRWVIGNAIARTMTVKHLPWMLGAITDRTNGKSRGQLVYALSSIKTNMVEDTLIGLLGDDEIAAEALAALGKLKSVKAKAVILKMRESNDSLIRLEATKALKRIG